jgi:hypothetical protein
VKLWYSALAGVALRKARLVWMGQVSQQSISRVTLRLHSYEAVGTHVIYIPHTSEPCSDDPGMRAHLHTVSSLGSC